MLRLLVSGVFRRYKQLEVARQRKAPDAAGYAWGDEEDRWDVLTYLLLRSTYLLTY